MRDKSEHAPPLPRREARWGHSSPSHACARPRACMHAPWLEMRMATLARKIVSKISISTKYDRGKAMEVLMMQNKGNESSVRLIDS